MELALVRMFSPKLPHRARSGGVEADLHLRTSRLDQFVTVVARVEETADADLLQIVQTLDPPGSLFGLAQCRQQQARQNGDNGDDDEQSNQSETQATSAGGKCRSGKPGFHIVGL